MDIIFKGRRTDVQARFRQHVSAKLGKIEKLDNKAIRVDVEVSQERNPRQADRRERVELTIASRGPVVRAEASADDRYAAFDRAFAKLEARLRRSGERRRTRRGTQLADRDRGLWPVPEGVTEPAGVTGSPAGLPGQAGPVGPGGMGVAVPAAGPGADGVPGPVPAGTGTGAEPYEADGLVSIQMEGDGPVVVREKYHSAQPMSIDQALLAMELVGHDFYLFRDEDCGHPSVVYRRRGYQYGLIRLVEESVVGDVGGRAAGRA